MGSIPDILANKVYPPPEFFPELYETSPELVEYNEKLKDAKNALRWRSLNELNRSSRTKFAVIDEGLRR